MALDLWWWPMSSPWLSPGAAWFVFFNLLVGAIALMSSRQQEAAGGHRRRLARTASTLVVESLRSFSIFTSHSGAAADYYCVVSPLAQHVHDRCCAFQEREAPELSTVAAASVAVATAVTRSEAAAAVTVADEAPVSAPRSEKEDEDESISLDQAYALARARRQAPAADGDTAAKVAKINRRRGGEEVEGKAEVNARAERFIRQFREELKLERLNSILGYTSALRRRSGVVTGGARGSSDHPV